ncbi:MAG: tetratricopeptide repeat protein [Limnospira sp. PMC 1279.21]|uniref:tetratricopeptide repeat protein n=1 Tax=Limnospira sp. PMC 1279.21 TaxID=2981062 RepID=UPI0028E18401|nr:tetratricopeptide repeat protein [Limnospira sp. PMC 1279.21]MDT9225498.1 tetratricopeptide repeat protein [Limnospira sp. PMC 1279.21]
MPYNLNIPGQFTERGLWAIEALAKLVPPGGVVVEVGSFLGLSSYAWAKSVHSSVTVYCIDSWEQDVEYAQKWRDRYQTDYNLENFREFTKNCPNLVALPGLSPQDFADWDKSIDLYCLNVDYQNIVFGENLSFWSQFLKPDGIICGRGYGQEFPMVIEEVRKLTNLYSVEPVIVEGIWCIASGVDSEKLNGFAKINEIHGYEYELSINEPPALLEPGDLLKVSGKLQNISRRDWDVFIGERAILKIGIQVYEENKPGRQEFRISLGVDKFMDGATIEFEDFIDTKLFKQGKIRLVFDVVAEGHYWFEEKGSKPQTITVPILPVTAGNLIKVGNQLKRAGKLTEAIASYRHALELNPNLSWLYYNLADALDKQGNMSQAVTNYCHAIDLNPNSFWFYYSFMEMLYKHGKYYQAIGYYQTIMKLQKLKNILYKNKSKKILVHKLLHKYKVINNDVMSFVMDNGFDPELYATTNNEKWNEFKACPSVNNHEINLYQHEKKIYSQNEEDGVIEKIFEVIKTTNKYYVEFGVENGNECNTRNLRENYGWTGLLMDGGWENKEIGLYKEFITAENINHLFKKYDVPQEFDLLCIDIDYNDFYVWKSLDEIYQPRVVIIQYNASHLPMEDKVVKYEPNAVWDGTNYCGASIRALYNLGKHKGYSLIYAEKKGVNLFFVKSSILSTIEYSFKNTNNIFLLYNYPQYGSDIRGGHRQDGKNREYVSSVEILST